MSLSGHSIGHSASADGLTIEKLRLVAAKAARTATEDTAFCREVRQRLIGVGSSAEDQVLAWERICMALPYRRELGELIDAPATVLQTGGDCDDLVCLFLAGCLSLGIPCEPEIITSADGSPFHIRALVYLPPLNPTHCIVVDPVCESEREWAMGDAQPADSRAVRLPDADPKGAPWGPLVLAGIAGILLGRLMKSSSKSST